MPPKSYLLPPTTPAKPFVAYKDLKSPALAELVDPKQGKDGRCGRSAKKPIMGHMENGSRPGIYGKLTAHGQGNENKLSVRPATEAEVANTEPKESPPTSQAPGEVSIRFRRTASYQPTLSQPDRPPKKGAETLTSNGAKGGTENIARPNGSNELFGWNKAKSRMASHGRLIRNFTSRLPRSYTVGSLMPLHEKPDVSEEARTDRGWPDQGQQPGQGGKGVGMLPGDAAREHETTSFRVEDGAWRAGTDADRAPALEDPVRPSGRFEGITTVSLSKAAKSERLSFHGLTSRRHIAAFC
jgi:hypothetical protein